MSFMNRPMRRLVVLECNKDVIPNDTANALILEKFEGDGNDRGLIDSMP